jgi:hypothetical protein
MRGATRKRRTRAHRIDDRGPLLAPAPWGGVLTRRPSLTSVAGQRALAAELLAFRAVDGASPLPQLWRVWARGCPPSGTGLLPSERGGPLGPRHLVANLLAHLLEELVKLLARLCDHRLGHRPGVPRPRRSARRDASARARSARAEQAQARDCRRLTRARNRLCPGCGSTGWRHARVGRSPRRGLATRSFASEGARGEGARAPRTCGHDAASSAQDLVHAAVRSSGRRRGQRRRCGGVADVVELAC